MPLGYAGASNDHRGFKGMNRHRSTLIGTAVAIALFGEQATAQAAEELEEVVVSGIRFSIEKSLDAKRSATSVVEVITAEDIAKMPDKNVADSLARVTGLTTSSAGANEGGFDENDRVSMRGTNPSLTQTLLNGHNVASGDWFVLNQLTQVGRSVSYTLLPSELVSQIVVHKSSQAALVEGGVAGSIDIARWRPWSPTTTRRAGSVPTSMSSWCSGWCSSCSTTCPISSTSADPPISSPRSIRCWVSSASGSTAQGPSGHTGTVRATVRPSPRFPDIDPISRE
jgi:hypothetical protein